MIVPCNTSVTVSMQFGGTTFDILPKTYNFGAISTLGTTCLSGFSTTPSQMGEQDYLDRPNHESHAQQDSGLSVTSSCETFTLSSTTEMHELDSPSSHKRSKVERIMLLRPGRLKSDVTERASSETRSKPANSRSLIYTTHLNSVSRSNITLLLITVRVKSCVSHWHIPVLETGPRC